MARRVVIGVDVGTTSTRAIAYDRHGDIRGHASAPNRLVSNQPDRAEQDPVQIGEGVLGCIAGAAAAVRAQGDDIAAVSFSTFTHSLIALDDDGAPLTPCLTWADNRARAQTERIRSEHDARAISRRTGSPVHPMSLLPKLLWFKEEQPDAFGRAARWGSIKLFLLHQLFGAPLEDHSVASASGLFNLRERSWDPDLLELIGLPAERLGRMVSTTEIVTVLRAAPARRLGIDPQTPFVVGANDGVLANVGVGALNEDVFACSIGTSGAIRTVISEPSTDALARTFTYALTDDRWVIGGAINNGGIALQWLRDRVFPEFRELAARAGREPYDYLLERAATAPSGSGGLVFLPYLVGERAPHWNPNLRGVFFGLTLAHERRHLIRAVLEGVVFQLHLVAQALEEVAGRPAEVRATGGFARSPLWVQIMADVFERDILLPDVAETSCWGAAVLGMHAVGMLESLEDAVDEVSITSRVTPRRDEVAVYRRLTPLFARLYEHLQTDFEEVIGLGFDLGRA
jgi:gluconokinase